MRLRIEISARGPGLAAFLLLALAAPAAGQEQAAGERAKITRRINQLEGQLTVSNGDSPGIYDELGRLRLRLSEGDFRAGDAIVLSVEGDTSLSRSFTIEPPRLLRLPGMDPIDLTGVLRDELQAYLQAELSRYLRNPRVLAYPLIRLGVVGGVRNPGFYLFRPETPLLDVFGRAGGFAPLAKTTDIELRRGGEPVVEAEEFLMAMRQGWDLQRLDVQPADEIYVPQKPRPMTTREWVLTITGLLGFTVSMLVIFNVL